MELVLGAKNSQSGVMKQERKIILHLELEKQPLTVKVCNFLVVENATSVEERMTEFCQFIVSTGYSTGISLYSKKEDNFESGLPRKECDLFNRSTYWQYC